MNNPEPQTVVVRIEAPERMSPTDQAVEAAKLLKELEKLARLRIMYQGPLPGNSLVGYIYADQLLDTREIMVTTEFSLNGRKEVVVVKEYQGSDHTINVDMRGRVRQAVAERVATVILDSFDLELAGLWK